jgi:hypothetical protein
MQPLLGIRKLFAHLSVKEGAFPSHAASEQALMDDGDDG